jgi:uncharacterized membrane protein YdjX (TVP38/TMEM64 family)
MLRDCMSSIPEQGGQRRKNLVLLGVGAIVIAVAIWARRTLGIEMDPQVLRDWIRGIGPAAPLVCIALVAFRALVGIPSQLALIVAGLCFGTLVGTLYGTLGLTISGTLTFLAARYGGREALERRIPKRFSVFMKQSGERLGAIFVAFGTGYPVGFLTAYHALAGITPMRLIVFIIALALGSSARAATYAYFGNSLITGGITPILQATAVLALAFGVPLLFPRSREWLKRMVLVRENPA